MQINWFTVTAQVINFLILVWLLKRFLYKPVLDAINEREKKIASQLNEAAAKTVEARKESDEFRQKNEAFDAEKKEQMNKVVAETEVKRKALLEEARKEAEGTFAPNCSAGACSRGRVGGSWRLPSTSLTAMADSSETVDVARP